MIRPRGLLPFLLALAVVLVGILALVPRPRSTPVVDTAEHVVLVGAPGLRWDDVSPTETPMLWRLAEKGAVGALVVRSGRSTTCPVDGWLTLGAGNYARGAAEPVQDACTLEYPTIERTGVGAKINNVEHEAIIEDNQTLPWGVEPGALSESARCTAAVGPGAAVAAARPFGRIDRYAPTVDVEGLRGLLDSCRLSFVDLGTISGSGTARVVQARRADAVLAAVLATRPSRSLIIVAGLSDTHTAARLHVAIAEGPGFSSGWLTSPSTGREGYVRLIDIAPTTLHALGRPVPGKLFAGAAASVGGGRPRDLAAAVDRLADADRLARTRQQVSTGFFTILALAQLALCLAVIPLLRRARGEPTTAPPRRPGRRRPAPTGSARSRATTGRRPRPPGGGARFATTVAACALTAAALATPAAMVVDIVPWWRAGRPGLVFGLIFLVVVTAVTVVVRAALIGRGALAPLGYVAGVVALGVGVDVLTGARLQLDGITGYSALAGGRYAGIGAIGLGLLISGTLVGAACLAQHTERMWRPVVVATVGCVAVVVTGSPYFGADAAGAVAFTAGVCVAAAMSTGGWLSYRRLSWAMVAALGVIAAFAVLDQHRPAAQRNSVGRLVDHVEDGTAGLLINRVGASSVVTFLTSPLSLLVIGGSVFMWFVLLRHWGGLRRVYGLFPAVRGALAGVAVATALAGVSQGVGLNIAGAAMSVILPLTVLTVLRVRHDADDGTADGVPAVRVGSAAVRRDDPPIGSQPETVERATADGSELAPAV